ncbi:MAG TPA: ATP-binding cassette domain-containing protein [Candidatus Onthousia faecipullorum]|uniref:ATP-binding cassette domain-containing protein n=1 Tax=Candidatus Onthousia faecipullorum TaxID=2840887 RepID=A0A9D1GCU7_9FIRM|nr:ATP-binding cassette domain-containing protein [Candidatus Onthousia faecipullorum]
MLELKNINKSYKTGDFVQHALNDVSLKFRKCEFVAILGSSGSGKTTLLNILGGLDRYDSGDLIINNKSTKKFKSVEWDYYRNNCVGFIFQSYNLISHISVLENVEMALILSGYKKKDRRVKALEALDRVGLKDHAHKKPNQLSGGQMQRVAIARALVNDPEIILADEPTGALDSVTSVQIMDLIKEIAKDKLVIMVTHNKELAEDYATRVVELKDGKILSDSNPVKDKENSKDKVNIKKTVLGYGSALKLSFNNIKTKKGRTFLTSFAASIGIIGIALILSLSNGFQMKIDEYEADTLSQMPITISSQAMDVDEEVMQQMVEGNKEHKEYSNKKFVYPRDNNLETMMHINNISSDYVDYIESMDKDNVSAISYLYGTTLNVVTRKADGTYSLVPTSTNYSMSTTSMTGVMGWSLYADKVNGKSMLEDNYDILAGSIDKDTPSVVIAVNSRNELDSGTLEQLGFDTSGDISFDDILNKEFKVIPNDIYYDEINNYFVPSNDYEDMYNDSESITVKVTAIIREKEDKNSLTQSGIYYNSTLVDEVINKNKDSEIVNRQKSVDYNVLTGQAFDETISTVTKDNILGVLGAEVSPSIIYIYPKDFDTKNYITDYLDDYNEEREDSNQVLYTDYASLISTLSGSIMDAVTYVLIAFSSISLVVSCIMIAIITYISVLERTKEIGILRALGARGKDITRVFNAETFIIGVCSGVLGLVIAYLLTFPINSIIESLADLPNVAKLNSIHAIVLLVISVTLTVLSGFVPSKMASKKDPVIALRTE